MRRECYPGIGKPTNEAMREHDPNVHSFDFRSVDHIVGMSLGCEVASDENKMDQRANQHQGRWETT